MNHQPPDYEYKYGHSEIIKNSLYLGGEDDIDHLLYGEEEARHLNGKGTFKNAPTPLVDTWIDLRDHRSNNRMVFIPENVEYLPFPFRDGFLDEAREHLPKAKEVLSQHLQNNKRVLVTCHQGRSRSVMLLLWYLAEQEGSFFDAYWTIKGARPIMEPDKNFKPLLEQWKKQYPMEKGTW
jgi:protein-tyrosine phosphatase